MFHFISFRLQFSLVHRLAHGSVLCGDNCIIIFRSLSNVMTQKPIDANVSWQNTMRRPRTEPTGNSHVVSIGFLFGEIIIIIGVYLNRIWRWASYTATYRNIAFRHLHISTLHTAMCQPPTGKNTARTIEWTKCMFDFVRRQKRRRNKKSNRFLAFWCWACDVAGH